MTVEGVQRVADIRQRTEAATEGPWEVWFTNRGPHKGRIAVGPDDSPVEFIIGEDFEGGFDAEFIAHARSDVPFLLDRLEAAEKRVADAWDEGYGQGVEDERTSVAADLHEFGLRVPPARSNPYRSERTSR